MLVSFGVRPPGLLNPNRRSGHATTVRSMPSLASPRVVASFAAIYLIWGSTFLAIRWAVETIPPFTMMATRCLLGGAILLAISRLREPGSAWPTARQWLGAACVGFFFFAVCHGLLAREEQHVPS